MESYWANRNVFLTGINGFIGGNLAAHLLDQGANVFGLIRNLRPHSFLNVEKLNQRVTLINGDLLDIECLERIISEEQIEVIFHLGAQVEVGVGMENPYITLETNVRGTYNLMCAIHRHPKNIKAVVVASTDKSYGSYPVDMMPYQEDYPLKPEYPYDTSKACADLIAQSFANPVYKLPIVVTRFCNIYGPGQLNFSAIIPDAIRSALKYTRFIPRGNGAQVRDFLYVEDVCKLYLLIGEKLGVNPEKYRGEIYNAGTNTKHSVREVLSSVYRHLDNVKDLEVILNDMNGKKTSGEIDIQFMDFKKVGSHFGWEPKHNLEQGLYKTIEWFKPFLESKFYRLKTP